MLKLSGVTALTNNADQNTLLQRGIVTGDTADVLAVINATVQELNKKAPSAIAAGTFSEVLRPPTNITVTATQYSKTVTLSGWESWMEGCTVRITGDTDDNRLDSQTTLLGPYMGNSGATLAATVFADSLALPSTHLNVIEPISLSRSGQSWPIAIAGDKAAFRAMAGNINAPAELVDRVGSVGIKTIGTPRVAFVTSEYDPAAGFLPLYIRFHPMPDQAYKVEFTTKFKPPTYTLADIEGEEDPGTEATGDWNESVLLPVAKKRWTEHPSCVCTPQQLQEIDRQYHHAIDALDGLIPRTGSVMPVYL